MSEENIKEQQQQQPRVNLDDIQVTSQDVALNLMAQFLEVAQKRGAFSMQEAAKIYQCVKFFRPTSVPTQSTESVEVNTDDEMKNVTN
jgi:hypothetical protein